MGNSAFYLNDLALQHHLFAALQHNVMVCRYLYLAIILICAPLKPHFSPKIRIAALKTTFRRPGDPKCGLRRRTTNI